MPGTNFEESVDPFIDEMVMQKMKKTKFSKDRDRNIQERIAHKVRVGENEGYSKYDKKFFNTAIDSRYKLFTKRDIDPLLEDTKQKGDLGGRATKQEGGELDDQMSMLMGAEETHTMPDGTVMPGATHEEYEQMLPDEEMEEDYVDYVMQETLSNEDRNYLIDALEKDDRLSMIFDQVVESATEFSGSGPIEGPGNEKSDSIPARLSDGEFVITAKATEEIGADNLMSMMKDAEAAADERQSVAYGGMVEEEGDPKAVPIQTTGSVAAQGNIPNVAKQSRQVEEEMLKSSPRRYYVPVSG